MQHQFGWLSRPVSIAVAVGGLLALCAGRVSAQAAGEPGGVVEADVIKMSMTHYHPAEGKARDPDFEWRFTRTEFVLKKEKGPVPAELLRKVFPDNTAVEEVRGKWRLEKGGRQLVLTEIKAGGKAGPKAVVLPIGRTAGTVVRIFEPQQYVFEVKR